jgi:inosose dehydratase
MPFNPASLGVQSWCFREFKERSRLIAKVKECGLAHVELCGVHADFSDEPSFDRVIGELRDAGIAIVSIGVQHFAGDEARERKYFEFAKRCGAGVISADFSPDPTLAGFRSAERLASAYGIRLAIHNHGGRHWLGNASVLAAVFAATSPSIGLCLDTAWALDAGEDPVAMARTFAQRLYGVHVKDFTFDRARRPHDVVVGAGNLDLPKLLAAIDAAPGLASCVIEYEEDPQDPAPAITQCVAAIRSAAPKAGAAHAR